MIPIQIELKNFLSYRGLVSIDFSGLGLACLSGENGAGKSAILDAITWSIWGKSRAQRDVDLISLQEDETEVTFTFRMGMRDYRILRRRTRSRPTLEFDSRSHDAENWLPIGGDSIRDTQARIIEELRLDYDTFANSAFLRQGEADLFTQNRPAERKRILSDILDLAGYDALVDAARLELRHRRARTEAHQSRLGEIDVRLTDRHQIEVELATIDDAITTATKRSSELAMSISALQERVTAAAIAETQLARAQERIARLEARAAQLTRQRSEAAQKLARADTILAREQAIAETYADQLNWRDKARKLSDSLAARQPIQNNIQLLERQVKDKRSELERQVALLTQSISTLTAQRADVARLKPQFDALEAELAAQQSSLAEFEEMENQLENVQGELSRLQADNAGLRSRMDDIKQRIEALDAGAASCPVCRRPLGDGDHEHIHDEWAREGRALGDKYRSNTSNMKQFESKVAALREKIAALNTLSRAAARTEAELEQLRGRLSTLPELDEQLAKSNEDLEQLRQTLASDRFMAGQQAELAKLNAQLAAIRFDPDELAQATSKSQHFDEAQREYQLLQSAKSDANELREQVRAIGEHLAECATELEESVEDVKGIEKSLEGVDEARSNLDQFSREQLKLNNRLSEMERQRGGLRRQLEELDELAKEQARLNQELKVLAVESDAYNELSTAFGRNGIQAMVIENVLPELQDEANRILARMTTKQLEVEFRTTRAAVSSDSTIETLDILIQDESGRRDYQLFSGGEAFRINFAIRVALSKLLARRAGASVEMLVIDEGFGTQDQHGRDGLIEALQSVTPDFELILVITHVDELKYQFPHRIEVVKTDEGSRVTLA